MVLPVRDAKKIVVKVGTSTLTYPTGRLNIRRLEILVKVLSDLKNSGKDIVLVSSGAIGVGAGKLGLKERPKDIPSKQAAAAVGQCELMYLYDKLFEEYGHVVAQVLLNRDAVDDHNRKRHIINTFEKLLSFGSIPIVNENDTVSTEEIEFGDNDTLSAIVAQLVKAELLVVLSDIDGLYDSDPHDNPGARLISRVDEITGEITSMGGEAVSGQGTGGMATKLSAAKLAIDNGVDMVIMNGKNPKNLYRLFDGEEIGTYFASKR